MDRTQKRKNKISKKRFQRIGEEDYLRKKCIFNKIIIKTYYHFLYKVVPSTQTKVEFLPIILLWLIRRVRVLCSLS